MASIKEFDSLSVFTFYGYMRIMNRHRSENKLHNKILIQFDQMFYLPLTIMPYFTFNATPSVASFVTSSAISASVMLLMAPVIFTM
jgi:hypothetical protein